MQRIVHIGHAEMGIQKLLAQRRDPGFQVGTHRLVRVWQVVGIHLLRDRGAVDQQFKARPRAGRNIAVPYGQRGQQRVGIDADSDQSPFMLRVRRVNPPGAVRVGDQQPLLIQKLEQVGLAHAGRTDHRNRRALIQHADDLGHFFLTISRGLVTVCHRASIPWVRVKPSTRILRWFPSFANPARSLI